LEEEIDASNDFNFGVLMNTYERESAIQEGEIKRGIVVGINDQGHPLVDFWLHCRATRIVRRDLF
jgi:hypothetical protein